MLRLLQILYLELVFVEVSIPLLELVSDFLPLLLKHFDLLLLLLELRLDDPLVILGLLHFLPVSVPLLLYLLLFLLYLLLFLQILLVLFLELLPLFGMFLGDFDDLFLVVVLHSIQLSIVDLLECLARPLRIHVLPLNLDHVALELRQQLVDRPLVLPLQVIYPLLVVFAHLELLLLELQVVAALHVQLSLVDSLQVFDRRDMVFFHLVHRLLVLMILEILLSAEIFVALLKILDVEVLLSLDLLVLTLVLELGLAKLQLHFTLVH